jgi:hypothetical protein
MPSRDRVRQLVDRVGDELPPMMTELGYSRSTCILHTRVATTAIRHFGVRARPLACRLMVCNQAYVDLRTELGRPPAPDEYTAEAHTVGIGYGSDGPGYDAHVVTVVEDRYVLDLTLDQASRPQRGIVLEPVYFEVSKAFLAGDENKGLAINDAYVVYGAVPEDKGFLSVPDWTEPMRLRSARLNPTAKLIAAVA